VLRRGLTFHDDGTITVTGTNQWGEGYTLRFTNDGIACDAPTGELLTMAELGARIDALTREVRALIGKVG
jgi:hypothetical protein